MVAALLVGISRIAKSALVVLRRAVIKGRAMSAFSSGIGVLISLDAPIVVVAGVRRGAVIGLDVCSVAPLVAFDSLLRDGRT